MTEENNSVALPSIILPDTAGVSLPTFMNVVRQFGLTRIEVGLFVEMIETHHVSVPYVGKLLSTEVSLSHVHAAYVLRAELDPLYDPNTSQGNRASEFQLPVDKGCEFLARLFSKKECDDDDSCIGAAARLLSEMAERCPPIQTWSSILDILAEINDPLRQELEARVGDMLDLLPDEKVEMMINIIDSLQLVAGHRF